MRTVGCTGLPDVSIGSTAENALNQVNCSVMAVMPGGFVSPVSTEAA